jgi:hypothetical protein
VVKRKIGFWLLATAFLATVPLAQSQQSMKIPRIGHLSAVSPSSISDRIKAFRQGPSLLS